MTKALAAFLHPKHGGKVDSLCTKCYLTIATAETVEELVAPESAHLCEGMKLGALVRRGEPTSTRPPRENDRYNTTR
jgi:hypothetical protein